MNISDVRNTLIPKLKSFCNVPIIEADTSGPKPKGKHATYKFTNPYGKDIGGPIEEYQDNKLVRSDTFKTTISFSSYDMDDDVSRELAQQIYDWFAFYGEDYLRSSNIAVVDSTDVINRDAFIVENYERRNGFDVIIRVARELTRDIGNIETVGTIQNKN